MDYGGEHNIEVTYFSCKEHKVCESSFSAAGETMHTLRWSGCTCMMCIDKVVQEFNVSS